MTDLPMLFSTPMVRGLQREAATAGTGKTQTRRAFKRLRSLGPISEFGPSDTAGYDWHFRDRGMRWHDLRHARLIERLPYAIGDRVWVREAWQEFLVSELPLDRPRGPRGRFGIPAESAKGNVSYVTYRADGEMPPHPEKGAAVWCSPIFMARWASRLTLLVTDVRVERLQDIGEADARAEGLACLSKDDGRTWKFGIADRDGWPGTDDDGWPWADWHVDPRRAYVTLWDRLHGRGAWDANPWIVALTFTVHAANIDRLPALAAPIPTLPGPAFAAL